METKRMVDVSNGHDVADGMILYVNSFSCPSRHFYDAILKKPAKVQHDFTMLCIEWFEKLAEVSIYDERNAAAVEFARNLPGLVIHHGLEKHKLSSCGREKEFHFDFRDDDSAADMLERYLSVSKDNDKFIFKMLRAHKTLQQIFSSLCCGWFKTISDIPAQNKPYITLAKKAAAGYNSFPMI